MPGHGARSGPESCWVEVGPGAQGRSVRCRAVGHAQHPPSVGEQFFDQARRTSTDAIEHIAKISLWVDLQFLARRAQTHQYRRRLFERQVRKHIDARSSRELVPVMSTFPDGLTEIVLSYRFGSPVHRSFQSTLDQTRQPRSNLEKKEKKALPVSDLPVCRVSWRNAIHILVVVCS
jgi:hypothetical protein